MPCTILDLFQTSGLNHSIVLRQTYLQVLRSTYILHNITLVLRVKGSSKGARKER